MSLLLRSFLAFLLLLVSSFSLLHISPSSASRPLLPFESQYLVASSHQPPQDVVSSHQVGISQRDDASNESNGRSRARLVEIQGVKPHVRSTEMASSPIHEDYVCAVSC